MKSQLRFVRYPFNFVFCLKGSLVFSFFLLLLIESCYHLLFMFMVFQLLHCCCCFLMSCYVFFIVIFTFRNYFDLLYSSLLSLETASPLGRGKVWLSTCGISFCCNWILLSSVVYCVFDNCIVIKKNSYLFWFGILYFVEFHWVGCCGSNWILGWLRYVWCTF